MKTPQRHAPWSLCLMLCTLVLGCGDEVRDLTFGPGATVMASGINPDCEELTPMGEFSGELWLEIDGAEVMMLDALDHLPLGEGETATLALHERVTDVAVGAELCVTTRGMEEDDSWDDDELSDDSDCHVLEAATAALTFSLQPQTGSCALQLTVPATVGEAGDVVTEADATGGSDTGGPEPDAPEDGPPLTEEDYRSQGIDPSVASEVEGLVWDLAGAATLGLAVELAAELCALVDDNPVYTSYSVFSTVGKVPFAQLIRSAYGSSEVLVQLIEQSGYWAASGEAASPASLITQTWSSCQTNVAFVNAACFATGPQYDTGGSYKASDAPDFGGCDESKH